MTERKAFLLRLPADVLDAMQRWARDDLRSLNAQIEFVLREGLRQQRRTKESPIATDPRDSSRETRGRAPDSTRAGHDDAGDGA